MQETTRDETNASELDPYPAQRVQDPLPLQVFRVSSSSKQGRSSRRSRNNSHRKTVRYSSHLPRISSSVQWAPKEDNAADDMQSSETPRLLSPSELLRKVECTTFISAPFDMTGERRSSLRLPLIFPIPTLENNWGSEYRLFNNESFDHGEIDVDEEGERVTLGVESMKSNPAISTERTRFSLLNSDEYKACLDQSATNGHLSSNKIMQNSSIQNSFTLLSHRSSAPVPCITDGKEATESHVVGELGAFTTNIMRYFDNPDLSDIILLVGEHRFYAHKFALASQSDVFRDMMIVTERCVGCPDFQKELELNESQDCRVVFPQFLRFFYCGKISLNNDSAMPLLVLAAKYHVESLRLACDSFIAAMIEDGDLASSIKWLKYAAMYNLQDLATKCVDGAIADNIEDLVVSLSWQELLPECVEAILRSSWLLVADEFFIFEAVQRWFINRRKSTSDDEIGDELQRILPHIRFSQMHSNQLLAVEESPLGLHHRSTIRTYLSDAYRYQILAKQCSDFCDPQYLPRDYTDKQWCLTMHFHPTRNKRSSPTALYGNGRWEIQPRRYYDTVNVVIILKKPLDNDVKVCISILMYKRNGDILMRLRRKPCVLRPMDLTPRSTVVGGARAGGVGGGPNARHETRRSNSALDSVTGGPDRASKSYQYPHKNPHGPINHLRGPHNGQEYYAIDNIVSDADFQTTLNQSGPSGIKFGIIIRTWSVET